MSWCSLARAPAMSPLAKQFGHGHCVVLRMEHLQAELAAELVQASARALNEGICSSVTSLGVGEMVCTGVTVAEHDIGGAALGHTLVEVDALFGDGTVACLVAGGSSAGT